jgi:AAA+ superfamily predicted ATPase
MGVRKATEQILRYLQGGHPLIFIRTSEENRVKSCLAAIAGEWFSNGNYLFANWDIASGWNGHQQKKELPDGDQAKSLLAAVNFIHSYRDSGMFLLHDATPFLQKPNIARALRNLYHENSKTPEKFIFFVSPSGEIPQELRREVVSLDFPAPDAEEIELMVDEFFSGKPIGNSNNAFRAKLCLGLRGFKEPAVRHLFNTLHNLNGCSEEEFLEELFRYKEQVVKEEGFLEFIPPRLTLKDVGGLDNVKDWLTERKPFFCDKAYAERANAPKGLMMMGISGCGKSLAIKAISAAWDTPLFRLRMGNIFSGNGSPEERFFKCLKLAEELAPVILWIDEIEKCLSLDEHAGPVTGSGGVNSRIFSEFLTWLEEKPTYLFVAATANRIEALPAELIRRGRFDEIFYVDLPSDEERKNIFEIHLRKAHLPSNEFDVRTLVMATRGWSGAEIEQVVNSSVIHAISKGQELTTSLLLEGVQKTVPLSRTQEEQVSKLQRHWALGRATPASRYSSFKTSVSLK